MNGIGFFMTKQGRSFAELAEQTGLPEMQVLEMMEDTDCEKPSHFYMRMSAALGVPVELLVKQYPEKEEGEGKMIWEDRFERRPDTICKIYLAKINGPHAEYRFNRTFQHVSFRYRKDDIYCCVTDLVDGVYEVCARWYDIVTGEVVHHRRQWFAVYEDAPYEVDEKDVLYTLFNIEVQKGRKSA